MSSSNIWRDLNVIMLHMFLCLQCSDSVVWAAEKGIRPVKKLSVGMLVVMICQKLDANDLHVSELQLLSLASSLGSR